MTLENSILVIGGTLTGLLAGVFYAFSVAIVPALRQLTGREHIQAMQAINQKIQNPIFFLSFLGPTILLPLATFLLRGTTEFPFLLAATALHIVGANGVTIAGNIPVNERIDKIEVSRVSETEAEQIRNEFQGRGAPWMRFHTARTWAAIAATALVFIACLSRNQSR